VKTNKLSKFGFDKIAKSESEEQIDYTTTLNSLVDKIKMVLKLRSFGESTFKIDKLIPTFEILHLVEEL
jgi:hypothetical protein